MLNLSEIPKRLERGIRLMRVTRGACYRMKNLRPPYRFYFGNKSAFLDAEDTDESRGIFAEVILYDSYGLSSIDHNSPPRRILDIGANIGSFSVFASLHFPEAEIHAYEPHPLAFSWLKKNTQQRNVKLFNLAVADRAGELKFDQQSKSTLSSLSQDGMQIVNAVSQDQVLSGQTIDFVKMDCEGAEFMILSDGGLLRRTKRLAMEYHLDEKNTFKNLEYLLKLGQHKIIKLTRSSLMPDKFGILWSERSS